ncbi:MAG: hypothetical protein HY696_05385 [Deltaproteobacteria bacterium]|nr:hypothetical protein [Deltaproteobacteria bacterium]
MKPRLDWYRGWITICAVTLLSCQGAAPEVETPRAELPQPVENRNAPAHQPEAELPPPIPDPALPITVPSAPNTPLSTVDPATFSSPLPSEPQPTASPLIPPTPPPPSSPDPPVVSPATPPPPDSVPAPVTEADERQTLLHALLQLDRPIIVDTPKPVHVTTFGAIPDDGIDDTAMIQQAIDTAIKQGGINATKKISAQGTPVVYFPRGVYQISKPLTISLGGYAPYQVLRVLGDWATLRVTLPVNAAPLTSVLSVNIAGFLQVEGLILDANEQAIHGLETYKFGGGRVSRMERMIVMRALGDGLAIRTSTGPYFGRIVALGNRGHGWRLSGDNGLICEQCAAVHNGGHGFAISGAMEQNVPFSGGCHFYDVWSHGNRGAGALLSAQPLAGHDAVSLRGGRITENSGDGLSIDAGEVNLTDLTIASTREGSTDTDDPAAARAIRLFSAANGAFISRNRIEPAEDPGFAAIAAVTAVKHYSFLKNTIGTTPQEPPVQWVDASPPLSLELATEPPPAADTVQTALLTQVAKAPLAAASSLATPIDITLHGAVSDDGLDDGPAIQAALDLAGQRAQQGLATTVFIPRGIFHIGTTLVLSGTPSGGGATSGSPVGSVRIISDWGILRRSAPVGAGGTALSGASVLRVQNAAGVQIERVQIDATTSPIGLEIVGSQEITLRGVTVHGAISTGVRVLASRDLTMVSSSSDAAQTGVGWWFEDTAHVMALALRAMSNRDGVVIRGAALDHTTVGLWAELNTGDAVRIEATARGVPQAITFQEGWFEGNQGDGVRSDAGSISVEGLRMITYDSKTSTRGLRIGAAAMPVRLLGNRLNASGFAGNYYGNITLHRTLSVHDEIIGNFGAYNSVPLLIVEAAP